MTTSPNRLLAACAAALAFVLLGGCGIPVDSQPRDVPDVRSVSTLQGEATSIPAQAYHTLPPIPAGQTPSGAYLLFAYLQYAEQLAARYETAHLALEQLSADAVPNVNVRPSKTPSPFAIALANRLAAEHRVGSDVHWGNEGFCVDVALHHPTKAEEVTVGVLCDTTRFTQSSDPVEWDIFRTGILESQGWQLHRIWTPHFYRDADGGVKAIINDAHDLVS